MGRETNPVWHEEEQTDAWHEKNPDGTWHEQEQSDAWHEKEPDGTWHEEKA